MRILAALAVGLLSLPVYGQILPSVGTKPDSPTGLNDQVLTDDGAGGFVSESALTVDSAGNVTVAAPIIQSTSAGLTASTDQSQGQGPLTSFINEVSTVANPGGLRTLPTAVAGVEVVVINNGANTMQVFPASGDDLGLGLNLAIELEANETAKYVAYDATNWKTESTTELLHAEMHDTDNTDVYVVNDAGSDFHAYHTDGLSGGDLAGWKFDIGGGGTSFPIASVANSVGSPGSQILVTTTGSHGLAVNDVISQTNLADPAYVGLFVVAATASDTSYEVAAVFTATGTGTVDQAAALIADIGSSGAYLAVWAASGTSASNNETFDFELCNDAVIVVGSKVVRKFGTGGDFGSWSGVSIFMVADEDHITLNLSNQDSAANITIRNLTITLTRL